MMNYHDKMEFIESRIKDFAEHVMKHGLTSNSISKEDNDLVDILYEHIEDSLETFLPELDYDV